MHLLRLALAVALASLPVLAQDDDPRQRARMARDLGRQGSSAIERLQPMLSDTHLEVRLEAVKALVEIGTQHSLAPLIEATRDVDPEIQIRATDGLVNFYLPGYVQTGLTASIRRAGSRITAMFTDNNDAIVPAFVEVRPDVIEALGKLARGGMTMEARANAARAVGILRGKAAIPDLIEALHSKDDQVIYESLIALQKIRDPDAAPRIAFLLRDFKEKVQIAAIETTGLLQNKEALPDLRNVLERSRSKRVQRAALTAIAMLPDESSRRTYTTYFTDRDDGLRAAAAEGFARLGNTEDIPMIEKAFNEERKMNPRLSMAFALVALGKAEISEFSPLRYLVNTLNSRSWRGIANPFLVELARKDEIRKTLHTVVPEATKDEKIGLAQVLAKSGDQESLAVLDKLTVDADAEVAQEALRATRTLKTLRGL